MKTLLKISFVLIAFVFSNKISAQEAAKSTTTTETKQQPAKKEDKAAPQSGTTKTAKDSNKKEESKEAAAPAPAPGSPQKMAITEQGVTKRKAKAESNTPATENTPAEKKK